MKSISKEILEQIQIRIKNKIDIFDLIENVNIKGLDLSNAIISKLRIIDGNISGCNFSNCILGNDTDIFTIIKTNIENCNFNGALFIGKAMIRSCNAKNCNFKNADVSKVDYSNSDFRGSTFCGAIIRIDSRSGAGCSFGASFLQELSKEWLNQPKISEE